MFTKGIFRTIIQLFSSNSYLTILAILFRSFLSVSTLTSLHETNLGSLASGTIMYKSNLILEGTMIGFGNLDLLESHLDLGPAGRFASVSSLLSFMKYISIIIHMNYIRLSPSQIY